MKRGIIIPAILFLLAGCSFFSPRREYEIRFPALPGDYRFIETWEVDVLSLGGGERHFSAPRGQSCVYIEADKEEALIVLAFPAGPGPFRGRPACLYLDGRSGARGVPDFSAGPAGSVLRDVLRSGYDLRRFNTARFFLRFNRNDTASPWFVDLAGVAERIRRGDMALYGIRAASLFPLDAAWEGVRWIGEDPFLGPGIPPLLPEGGHRFYDPEEGRILEIRVDSKGNVSGMEYPVRIK